MHILAAVVVSTVQHLDQVCLGTMTMGSMSDESTAVEILDRYVELGGNFIDTAEMYPVPCEKRSTPPPPPPQKKRVNPNHSPEPLTRTTHPDH